MPIFHRQKEKPRTVQRLDLTSSGQPGSAIQCVSGYTGGLENAKPHGQKIF